MADSTTDGGGGPNPASQPEHKARVFAYALSSSDPKKNGPTKAEMDRVAALFPPSSLAPLASHLQALMRRSGAVDASGAPVSPQPDALLAGTKRVFHFRAHYLIYWLLADKEKGLREITTERDAFALAQLLFASKVPLCVPRRARARAAPTLAALARPHSPTPCLYPPRPPPPLDAPTPPPPASLRAASCA